MVIKKIEIGYKNEGNAYDYVSFPEVAGYNVSVKIDKYIISHLDFEIDWAKKNNIRYSNKDEIRSICSELIKKQKLLEHFFAQIEHESGLKPIIKPISERQSKKNTVQIKAKKNTFEINKNKTYLMKDNHNKLYKIGYSKNPTLRERTLQSEKPSLKMIKVWDYNIEKKLHNLYDEFRVRGEWFSLTKVQVQYICTHF